MRERVNNVLKVFSDNNETNIYAYKSSDFDDLYTICDELKEDKNIFVFYPEEKPECLYDIYEYTQENFPFLLIKCKSKNVFLCYEQLIMLSDFINISTIKNKIIILEDNFIRYKHFSFNESYVINKLKKKEFQDDEISLINSIYDCRIKTFLNGESLVYDYLDENIVSNLNYEIKNIFAQHAGSINVSKEDIEKINNDNSIVYLSQIKDYNIKCDEFFTAYEDNRFLEYIEKEKPHCVVIIGEADFIKKHKNMFNLWRNIYSQTTFKFVDCSDIEEEYNIDFMPYLKKYWKSEKFRNYKIYDFDNNEKLVDISQEKILKYIMNQIYRCKNKKQWSDIFFIASTGSGKSLLYQLPSIILEENKDMVLVISPLISLMKDQIYHLRNDMGIKFAAYINSELSFDEREEVLRGIKQKRYSLVYVSPEFLQVSYNMSEILKERELGLVVVDEAHCVSNWGKEFRTDYGYLGDYIERLKKKESKNFPILALTATAVYKGELGTVDEIMTLLHFNDERKVYFCDVKRNNIEININRVSTGNEDYQIKKEDITLREIKSLVRQNKKAIVYTLWKSHAYKLYNLLDKDIKEKVSLYLGDTKPEERSEAEKRFKNNDINVMIATKAFGMGVDIDDIKIVYHHTLTGNVCDYVQEIGRAARNKNINGIAYTYFMDKDFQYYRKLKGMSRPSNYQLSMILNKINQEYRYQSRKNRHCRELNIPLESLAFAFTEKDRKSSEQKIRQSLFLIEKDLKGAIKVYPKDDYSLYYCTVKEEMKNDFIYKYKEYIDNNSIISKESNKRFEKTYRWNPCRVSDIGDIFSFDLNKYWENQQKDLSFRNVKRKFFNGELFDEKYEVSPRVKITITLLKKYDETLTILRKYVDNLREILKIIKAKKSYIPKKKAENIIKDYLKENMENYNADIFSKTKHILFNLLSYNSDEPGRIGYKLIVIKKIYTQNFDESSERICVSGFTDRVEQLITSFKERFQGNDYFEKYIVPPFLNKNNHSSEFTTITMDLAYMLEILNLAKFELKGGKLPTVNIHIFHPMELYKPKYKNKLLKDMRERDQKEIKVMYKIINTEGSNSKWKTIEDYFLGNINIE
jgi:ATP-dependent DNA helicase RecQ